MQSKISERSRDLSAELLVDPLVSIIIPCYNGGAFLSRAIESALGQTHNNIEVVVVDDGSTDNSAEIMARYPVRRCQGERGGVSAARNRGLRESRGAFVLFLDADDLLLPHAAAAGLACMRQHSHPDGECAMAVGAHRVVACGGAEVRERRKPLRSGDPYARLLKSNFIECISSVLFRRDALPTEVCFKPGLAAAEDYDLYLRLARAHRICCHDEVVAEYHLHESNVSGDAALMLASTLRVLHQQRAQGLTSIRRLCCFEYGLWSWSRKYGRQLTRQLAVGHRGRGAESPELWRTLAQTYPTGVLIALAVRVLPSELLPPGLRRHPELPSSRQPAPHLTHS